MACFLPSTVLVSPRSASLEYVMLAGGATGAIVGASVAGSVGTSIGSVIFSVSVQKYYCQHSNVHQQKRKEKELLGFGLIFYEIWAI